MSTRIPLAPGTLLGRYRIAGLAGEGGMGDIYEAFDTSLERVVALKRIRGASGGAGDAAQERFRREALALAQLNHPGICQVFELAETAQGAFIAMEWIEGETLRARLDRGPLPWREAAHILQQTAEALAPAHAKGLVHRDLKPSNLMITPDGRVKILDFGLVRFADAAVEEPKPATGETTRLELDPDEEETQAKLHGLRASGSGRSLTRVGSFMGTLGYTSPEQALARPVGPPSDVFNLGLLAQEMLTGERAFLGEGRDALDAVVDGLRQPLPRAAAPKAFRDLITRLLQREPKARPTALETAEALRRQLAPHGALWWSGLSAAAVILLGASGYWLFGRGVIAGLVKGRPARLAVMGFKNATGIPMLTSQTELGLADLVASRLRNEPKLQVIGADTLVQAAQALRITPAEASPDDQLRLAKAVGADLLLTGEVERRGGKDHLAFALLDTKGRARAQGDTEAAPLSGTMLNAMPLAQAATQSLHKALDPFAKKAPPEPYTIPPEAFAAYAQGVEAYRRGHNKEAEPLLKQAAYAVPEWPSAVMAFSESLSSLGSPEADSGFRWALVAAKKANDPQKELLIVQVMANLALRHRDFSTAEAYFNRALNSAESRKDLSSQAYCLNGLGRVAESRHQTKAAEANYDAALKVATQCGYLFVRDSALTNLGNLALENGDLKVATDRYSAAVENAHLAGSELAEATGLNNLGIVLFSQFKTRDAQAALERALALRQKNGDAYGLVSSLRNLGGNALAEGHIPEAQAYFQRSLDQAKAVSYPYGQGQAAFYLADLERRKGDLRAALRSYQAAQALSGVAHDPKRVALSQAGEAECWLRLHSRSQGEALLAKAAPELPGNPYLLRAQAWAAFLKGDRSQALRWVDQAILDPNYDAPELRPELKALRSRFALP